MADNNLTEIKAIRKREIFLELIKNTESCCMVWSEIAPGQYSAEKDQFSFIITKTGTGITLDVYKNCKLSASYSSLVYEDVTTLYESIFLILEKQFTRLPEEEERLIQILGPCHCPIYYDEVGSGGVVVAGDPIVHVPERYAEEFSGGVVVGGAAFVPERYKEFGSGGVVVGGSAENLVIGENTYIYIYFDASGSMNSTLAPLRTMRDTILKDALIGFYNNDSTAYDDHVIIVDTWSNEATFQAIHHKLLPSNEFPEDAGNVVVLLFQDESSYYSADLTFPPMPNSRFITDMTALRARLDTFPTYFYRAVIFQVEPYAGFKQLIQAVENGTGFYAPPNGLSDRDEFAYKYDTPDGATPSYYLEEILTALEELGFSVR